jgi:gamma-glutamyltranspeptidase
MLFLVCVAFLLGRGSGGAAGAAPAACPGGAAGSYDDTVAPEGPVSSNFEARHDYRGRPRALTAANGVVAADHGRCSDVGLAALLEGGSAVDAAVAVALCQGVYNPMASGVGGGHIMVIRLPNGTAEVVDAREVAPAAANETMFVGECAAPPPPLLLVCPAPARRLVPAACEMCMRG